jgi:hypothetical protein
MGRLTRYTILFALSLSCASFCLPANAQTNLQNKTIKKLTGSIAGRVTVKGKGKGGIVVAARTGDFGSQAGALRKATTDADGNYRITDLPAGNYQVMPVAPAFVLPDNNSVGRQGKAVILAEGEFVDDINFSMVHGSVITGRVSQADGRAVVEERVNVSLVEEVVRQGQAQQIIPNAQTDDRGIYRVFGLSPGRYRVFVGQSPDSASGNIGPGRPIYERVYYPDVANSNEARVIELGEGAEAANIDITVGESRKGFAASGVVMDTDTNQPPASLRLGLQKIVGDRPTGFASTSVVSDRLGAFRFENLTPGKYSVISMPQPNSDQRIDSITFVVVDQDVSGLALKVSRGASVAGTIFIEGTHDKTLQNKIAQLRLQAYVRGESPGIAFTQASPIGPDGSFRVGGLQPGTAFFQLSAQDRTLLTGFVVSHVERDGAVLQRGLEIKSGEQILGVKVVVVYGTGIVRGIVKVENGPLPTGARFMIRLIRPDAPSKMVGRSQGADARGRFVIEGVPGGSYDLLVNVYIPESRVRLPSTKQSVTVDEGAVVEVEPVITLENSQTPNP